ncbi:hypothetical protein [Bacteroides cellulosilyticus]|uniref:hypothetical protein n=1 Tax=Bacteroides cellulosilyticus TaxID=246787 RepID=UPI00189B2365|nr:hypothetical protein [Bacteroides cellulosilyticus]
MTKDEYIAFLEQQNMQYYKEIQQLTYEKGFLQGRLMVFIQQYPSLSMVIQRGGKWLKKMQEGGTQ